MRIIFILFFFNSSLSFGQTINENIYLALADSNESVILAQINTLENSDSSSQSNAYLGALYMKQSGSLSSVSKKINRFKEGRGLLEQELSLHSKNTEFHFLRLIIQEHVPSILKYNKDLEGDLSLIYQNYSSLDKALKKVILNYSKNSSIINSDLLIQ